MKKIFIKLFILPVLFLTGCSTQDIPKNIDSRQEIKSTSISISDIFNGVWVRNDGDSNMYFKIREDSIEYQSSDTFFYYHDVIRDITHDDLGKNIYLTTHSSCDYDENSKGDTIHIEVIDSDTIKLQGKTLTKVFNIEKAVNELAPIFETNYQHNPEYNLERFFEITSDDLKIMLNNKC